jgi:hypothetical protein
MFGHLVVFVGTKYTTKGEIRTTDDGIIFAIQTQNSSHANPKMT